MRRNYRSSLSLVVLIIAVTGVLWFTKQKETDLPLEIVPQVHHDHDHGHLHGTPELEPVIVDENLMGDFQSWLAAYRAGERGQGFMQQGLALAAQRRETMGQLIRRDSALAFSHAISYADFDALPSEMQALVEQPYTLTGDVLLTAICDHDYHTPEYRVDIFLEDETRLKVTHPGFLRAGLSKLDIPLQGIQLDGYAAVRPEVAPVHC